MAAAKTTRLKHLITRTEILVMPGVYDVISGQLVQQAGFEAAQVSGANLAACHYGVSDYSIVSLGEMIEHSGRIARALDIPVLGDADTGFGNAVNAYLAVRAFEAAGVAGINIEDQIFPKRCGHLDGKTVLPLDEAVMKVKAAAEARRDQDFIINARTDALATEGLEGVVRRGNAFLEAGATMVFVEGTSSLEQIRQAVRLIHGPVAVNLVEGGKSAQSTTFADLQDAGVARVSLPSTLMQASIHAVKAVLGRMREQGGIGGYGDMLAGFGISQNLVGAEEIRELEQRYLAPLLNNKAGA
ncbi:carboxyvinyl-carboxyphosphonate phosphorylmutase [Methylovirgula ligni]|uniref:Methylisocitrate lyase n=1 Tax=Methylovirgula ligni TaxID=569860 RepID=A0A3D9Z4L3_9HYPH|nr:isocitrate lyase/PEP mutase family protein [Methylovirgula ligni]QAY95487.1 carboxyvinyl-carboxyphosphonate phosphorylmutase [Methylovirgula ligni]REF89180.1 methylisocitrate lyase [Methylovirgula ligni]